MVIRRLRTLLLLVCFVPLPAWAQTAATLVGVVEDAQGGRLPGVTIRLRDVATGVARDLVSDGEGRFRAAALSPGEYELHASLQGFRPLVQTGVRLTAAMTSPASNPASAAGLFGSIAVTTTPC